MASSSSPSGYFRDKQGKVHPLRSSGGGGGVDRFGTEDTLENNPPPVVNSRIRDIAQKYNKSAGLPAVKDFTPQALQPEEGRRLADAYESAKDDPNDEETKASYDAFHNEVSAQWDALTKAGIKFEPWEKPGQPYQTSTEMKQDVNQNGHLFFFKTGGAGNEPNSLTTNEQNDKFRQVHDIFGHAQMGNQFGPVGETNAYLEHAQMFSPKAIPALTSETLAQNSTYNFGRNNVGKPADMRTFPGQKSALVPAETYAGILGRRDSTSFSAILREAYVKFSEESFFTDKHGVRHPIRNGHLESNGQDPLFHVHFRGNVYHPTTIKALHQITNGEDYSVEECDHSIPYKFRKDAPTLQMFPGNIASPSQKSPTTQTQALTDELVKKATGKFAAGTHEDDYLGCPCHKREKTALMSALKMAVQTFFTNKEGRRIHIREPHSPDGISTTAHSSELMLIHQLKNNGGFTFHTHTGEQPSGGYSLSPYEDRTGIFPGTDVTTKDFHDYMAKNEDLLGQPDHFFGGWDDKNKSRTALDVSINVKTPEEAERIGRAHNQDAYYDVANDKDVYIDYGSIEGKDNVIGSLADVRSQLSQGPLYIRYSPDIEGDVARGYSIDNATGKRESGLSSVKLDSTETDAELQHGISEYSYIGSLGTEAVQTNGYLLRGEAVGADSDGAPTIQGAQIVGRISDGLRSEALGERETQGYKDRALMQLRQELGASQIPAFGTAERERLVSARANQLQSAANAESNAYRTSHGDKTKTSLSAQLRQAYAEFAGPPPGRLMHEHAGGGGGDQKPKFFTDAQGKHIPIGGRWSQSGTGKTIDPYPVKPTAKIQANAEKAFKEMGLTPEGLRATFEGSYSEATDFERSSGHSWYDRTHDIAQALADRGNMPISNAAGSIAAMSPHNEFIRNLKDAKVAIDVVNGKFRGRELGRKPGSNKKKIPPLSVRAKMKPDETNEYRYRYMRDKPITELTISPAMAKHKYDEDSKSKMNARSAHPLDVQHYNGIEDQFTGQDFTGTHRVQELPGDVLAAFIPKLGGQRNMFATAMTIARGGDPDKYLGSSGSNKVRSFYNNVLDPNNDPYNSSTVDTHVIMEGRGKGRGGYGGSWLGTGQGSPGSEEVQNEDKVIGKVFGNPALYKMFDDALKDVGKNHGMRSQKGQAVIWNHHKNRGLEVLGKGEESQERVKYSELLKYAAAYFTGEDEDEDLPPGKIGSNPDTWTDEEYEAIKAEDLAGDRQNLKDYLANTGQKQWSDREPLDTSLPKRKHPEFPKKGFHQKMKDDLKKGPIRKALEDAIKAVK